MIMKKPEIDVIRFESADIVAASTAAKTITLSGMGNSASNDNGFAFGPYNYVGATGNTIRSSMADYFDPGFSNVGNTAVVFKTDTNSSNLNVLFSGGQNATGGYNGTYEYDGPGTYSFTKKS